MLYKGDIVKINMAVVKQHDSSPPYIQLVQKTIAKGDPKGSAEVVSVEGNKLEIDNSALPGMFSVWVPTDSATLL